jgi:glycosyltransferase involved in cell wall biosynthesis
MLSVLAATRAKKVFFEVMSGKPIGLRDPRRFVHMGFDAIVGQGNAVAAKFLECFGWRGPTVVIPALPEPLERTVGIAPRVKSAIGDRPLLAAYFGRLAAHKNVEFLIEHWEEIAGSDGSLDIWGTGPEQEKLASQIIAAGRSEKITLKGRYPQGADYIALMQCYDMTLLATIGDEGAPLVLLESMAAGVPFVANGVGGIGDYSNLDCYITNGNIADFVPMAQTLVNRLRSGDIDTRRLQKHYMSEFSFLRLVDRWDSFLTSL